MIHGKVNLPAPHFLVSFCKGKVGRTAGRCIMHLMGWMLLGFVIAGPSLPNLHSQEPQQREAKSRRGGNPSQRPHADIILPDIYIPAPTDTLAVLKQRLEHAERDLKQLQIERNRILKSIEEFEKRHQVSRKAGPWPRSTELVQRPSV